MKIVQINATSGIGSTGKICVSISKLLNEKKIENFVFYTEGKSDYPFGKKYSGRFYLKIQAMKSRVFGDYGFTSSFVTRKLIKSLEQIRPDIVHIHNIHGHNCNLDMLFKYLKRERIKTVYTFHDCWAFTGYCTHFTLVNCEKWKTHCDGCPQLRKTSWFMDRSKEMLERKKKAIMGSDLTIVTPSEWLARLVKQSYLKDYPVLVINNGIDLKIFKPIPSDFREMHSLKNKKIILGVAFGWGVRKGLDVFIRLSFKLPAEYQIVLVGTDDKVDAQLPDSMVSIHRTNNQKELAEIYSAADVFVNPTREEVFGLVNIEALACGTPVITFNTGGSPECIDGSCGSVVPVDDEEELMKEIIRICTQKPYSQEACLIRARRYDMNIKFQEYIELYYHLISKT